MNIREYYVMFNKFRFYTYLLLLVTILLITLGLLMVATTTYSNHGLHFFIRQLIWVAIGIVGAIAVASIPQKFWINYSHVILIGLAVILTYLFVCRFIGKIFGDAIATKMPFIPGGIKGGYRWLKFPFDISLQPSEFAKLALLMFLASYYGTRDDETIHSFYTGIVVPMIPTGYVLCAIFLGKDLSQTVITALMVIAIMFLAGVRTRYLTVICVSVVILGCCLILASPMRRARIMGWRTQTPEQKEKLFQTSRYQLGISELAIGGGGIKGRGPTKSIMKNDYLPEAHTDFIVAILGEEIGFIGIIILLFLYAAFMFLLFSISRMCYDKVSMLVCQGIGVLVPFQALINIGVVSGFFPTTGLTAPFISYGGSSSISLLMCMGLVFKVCSTNIARLTIDARNAIASPNSLRSSH